MPLDGAHQCLASQSNGSGAHPAPAADAPQAREYTYDVVTLGNLCVDIFIHLEQVTVQTRNDTYRISYHPY